MKSPLLIALIASALLIVLTGCQSATSSELPDDPQYKPIAPRKMVITGEYYMLADVDIKPRPTGNRATPVYPLALKRNGVSGEAVLAFVVSSKGKVEQLQVISATHEAFAYAAMRAVQQ